jgi:hypothetical protein
MNSRVSMLALAIDLLDSLTQSSYKRQEVRWQNQNAFLMLVIERSQ